MADFIVMGDPLMKGNDLLYPETSGEEVCLPGHYWGPGIRLHYLVHYVVSGKGTLYYENREFSVRKGDIFVVFPRTVIKYQADMQEPWHYVWTSFYGAEAEKVFLQMGITELNPVFSVKNGAAILETIRSMPLERSSELKNNLDFSARLYEFMSLLSDNASAHVNIDNNYFAAAKRYIKSHYFLDITVEGVAKHVGISRKYLFAIFKGRLGISPKDYMIDYRIKRATELLRDGSLSIGNVAYSVGYKDQMTFSKMFKLKTGVSPREFRENYKEVN